MPTTVGPLYPMNFASVPGASGWFNQTDALSSNDTFATWNMGFVDEVTDPIVAHDFGILIPQYCTIDSVNVQIECHASTSDVTVNDIRFGNVIDGSPVDVLSSGGLLDTANNSILDWTVVPTFNTSASDYTTSKFGVSFSVKNGTTPGGTVYIDCIRVSVTYSGGFSSVTCAYGGNYSIIEAITIGFSGTYSIVEPITVGFAGSYSIIGPIIVGFTGSYSILESMPVGFGGTHSILSTAVTQEHGGLYSSAQTFIVSHAGKYHQQNNNDAVYVAWVEENAMPDLAGPPSISSLALPMQFPVSPPPSGIKTLYVVVRKTNSYGLQSQNSEPILVRIDSTGTLLLAPIPKPEGVQAFPKKNGGIRVMAMYPTIELTDHPADMWRVWIGSSHPDPLLDIPTGEVLVSGDAMSELFAGPYAVGTYYVVVALYRSEDGAQSEAVEVEVAIGNPPATPTPVNSGFQLP